MTVIADVDAYRVGDTSIDALYAGDTLVWSSEFKLSSIPNMTLWVEADDAPQTVAGPITSAPARVGPTLTGNVYLNINGVGGHKSFSPHVVGTGGGFDATGIKLGPDFTVFVVVDPESTQPSQYADLVDFDHGNGGWVIQQDSFGPGNYLAWRVGGTGNYSMLYAPAYPIHPQIVEAHKSGGFVSLSFDSSTVSTNGSTGLDQPNGALRIGNFVNGSGRVFYGQISMIAGWDRALEPAELTQVRAYLTEKWGLPSFDPDTQKYLTATGLDPSYAPALDGLVTGLKAKGLWSKMVAVYPFIGGTADLHKWNLKDPRDTDDAYRLTYVLGTAPGGHSETLGYRPNLPSGGVGVYTGGYANTHCTPRGILDQDSTHLALYSLANMPRADRCDMGCYNWQGTGSRFHIIGYYTSGEYYYGMSEDGITSAPGIGHSAGLFCSTRTAANTQAGYRNGTIIGSSNAPSIWLPDRPVYVGAINEYNGRSDLSFGFASIGTGLTAQNNADLYTVVQAYQTALGRSI